MLVVLLLVGALHVSANSLAQTKVSLTMKNAAVEEVFQRLETMTGYTFLYKLDLLKDCGRVDVNAYEEDFGQLLTSVLRPLGLTFKIDDQVVVILRDDEEKEPKEVVIKGRVMMKDSTSVPGATVIVKGTTVGVITDMGGEFTIAVPKSVTDPVLEFSFVGLKKREVKYEGKDMVVVMEEEAQEVDEVVVTGYQTVKKSNMAGAVSTVNAEDLVLNGTQTLEQALQGKLPGVVVQNTSGLVGVRQKVRVRGTSTLLGSQDPVWVVDGIIQEDPLPFKATELTMFGQDPDNIDMIRNFVGSAISWLNPSDIKDVTVLKDASATAIYGVKAANGVIVITTKRGEKGRMSISYSGNFSIGSKVTYDKMNLMNSKERVDVSREIFESGLVSTRELANVGYQQILKSYLEDKISYEEFNAGVKRLEVVNTDWFDLLFENPFSHSHNVNISGGNDKATYYASFGVTSNNGTAKGNDSRSYQGSVNVTSLFWDVLQFSGRVSGSVSKTTGFNKVSPYEYASTTSRVIPAFDENGDLYYYQDENGFRYNVFNELSQTGNENTTNAVNASISLNWEIVKGLKFESMFGYSYTSSHGRTWASERSNYITAMRRYEFGEYGPEDDEYKMSGLPHGGELSTSDARTESWTWRNQLSWVKNWERHLVTVMVGQESKSTKYDGMTQTLYGYLPDRGHSIINPPLNTENGGIMRENTNYQPTTAIQDNKANTLSFYGAVTYTFDERYVLNASIRSDASNRFGQDKSARYQPVWSVGLRWNMGREPFLRGQDLLNEFSLRFSFGYQGNASEAAGPDLIAYMPQGTDAIASTTGEYVLKVQSLPNPQLKWEKTKTINLGADFVFWKNKINGSFEYYYKKTTDAIINRQVPLETGILSMPMNGGSIENSGWELGISFAPVRTKSFLWSLGLNTSKNYNEITSELETNENWQQATSGNLYKKGYPVSGFWAFELMGLNPEDGTPLFDTKNWDKPEAMTDATVYMKYMGKLDPDFTAGLNTSFKWKDLTLSGSFNLSIGGKKFLAPMFNADMEDNTPWEYNNMPKDLVNRWRKPGDEKVTNIPSLPAYHKSMMDFPNNATEYGYRMYNFTDVRVVSASFLRCNNITLTYNMSRGWIKRFAQNLGLSFTVSNPFVIVSNDFKGKDPEVATGSQPLTQNYTLSVNLSF